MFIDAEIADGHNVNSEKLKQHILDDEMMIVDRGSKDFEVTKILPQLSLPNHLLKDMEPQ